MPSAAFKILLILLPLMMLQSLLTPAAVAGEIHYITEYDIPTPESGPLGITADSRGRIWFAETNISRIACFDPEDQTFKEYQIQLSDRLREDGAQIWGLVFDASGVLWFTEATEAAIWRFDPSAETFERYLLQPTVFPLRIVVGPTGDLWFTELYGDRIGRLDPSQVVNNTREGVTEYQIPTPNAGAADLLFDKEGNLWFTESFSRKLGMFDPRAIRFTEHEMPGSPYALVGLASDEAGRLWITDHGSSEFYRFDRETGRFKDYATSESPFFIVSLPYYLTRDSTGRIWMNEHYGNIIAVIDPESEVLTEYKIPTEDPRFGGIANALLLTVDPGDNVWFTEWTSNKIAVLDPRLPLPFDIELSERKIQVERGEETELTVHLAADGSLDNAVTLYASGTLSETGALKGLAATFEPAELTTGQSTSTLTLKADRSLTPGTYTLMVGGRYSGIGRLAAVELTVGSPGVVPPLLETWGLLFLALTPLLAVTVALVYRRFRRRHRSEVATIYYGRCPHLYQ